MSLDNNSNIVKERRAYRSPVREAQARELRDQVVQAAERLFLRHGYAGTSMDAIAAGAGVARPTVFVAFGSKAAILDRVIERAIGAGEELNPVTERGWYRALAAEPDPVKLLRAHARYCCEVNARIGPVQDLLEAAAGDPKPAELLGKIKEQRLRGMRAV